MAMPLNEMLAVMDREAGLLTDDNWHASAAVMRDAAERLRDLKTAMTAAADIIDRNWNHQREKLPDASAILRQALSK